LWWGNSGGPGFGPHQPANTIEIASSASREPLRAKTAQNTLKTRVPEKIFGL